MNAITRGGPRQERGPVSVESNATKRVLPVVQRYVRRVHLYLGLFVWPFVLLFAVTALSFNHPTVGRALRVERLSASEVERATGFSPWDPDLVARRVVEQLNESGARYRLSEDHAAKFDGWPLFAAPSEHGQEVVIVSLSRGTATITERLHEAEARPAPFANSKVEVEGHDIDALAKRLEPALKAANISTTGPLRAHPEVHPELEFRMLDQAGKSWDVRYDLATATLDGRATDEPHGSSVIELFESLHKQHHYPAERDFKLVWALFADLTALTLIIWAVTGIVMWWQLKRLRRAGVAVVVMAILVAAAVMVGTASDLQFAGGSGEEE